MDSLESMKNMSFIDNTLSFTGFQRGEMSISNFWASSWQQFILLLFAHNKPQDPHKLDGTWLKLL